MLYRKLGSSDLNVSEIALGSWLTYGVGVDSKDALACVDQAFECGINFIDTANIYGRGAAETFLGDALKDRPRASYVLATKLFFPMTESDSGLSRAQIEKQIDASLKRLKTDYVDLYQCHRYDKETPLEETMEALTSVVKKGKTRYIGFSEWPAGKVEEAARIPNVDRFVSSQPQYSMLWRDPETAVLPLCKKLNISQIVWSPLAQGVLTGKYQPGQPLPTDSRAKNPAMNGFLRGDLLGDKLLTSVQNLKPLAEEKGISLAELALAWVLREKNVASAIIGASRPQQVIENCKASGVVLDPALLARIDEVLNGPVAKRA